MSQTPHSSSLTDFGANEWLVDEMHDRYLEDPDSVDEAWRELFAERDSDPGADGRPKAQETTSKEPASKGPASRQPEQDNSSTSGSSSNGASKPAGAKPAARREAGTPPTAKPPVGKPTQDGGPGPAPTPRTTTATTTPAAVTGSPATSSAAPTSTRDVPKPIAAKSVPSDRPVPKDATRQDSDDDTSDEPQHVILEGARPAPSRTWTTASTCRPPPASGPSRSSC